MIISCADNLAEYNFAILSTFNEVVGILLVSPLYSHPNAYMPTLNYCSREEYRILGIIHERKKLLNFVDFEMIVNVFLLSFSIF